MDAGKRFREDQTPSGSTGEYRSKRKSSKPARRKTKQKRESIDTIVRRLPGQLPQSRLTSKGQLTIPKAIRDYLGLKSGQRVKFFKHPDGSVHLIPTRPASESRGILKTNKHVTIEEMNEAVRKHAVARYMRSFE